MTEGRHPNEVRALALAEDPRFCEWLDATAALDCRWPHNPVTARAWLRQALGVESLGRLGTDPAAARALDEIAHRFALWGRNEELAL